MRWSENETYQFVKLYLNHEALWNPEHADYKSQARRHIEYRDMANEFKAKTKISLYENEVKTKIKSLRSTYTQELSKIKLRSGPDFLYKPNVKWFAPMDKLFKNIEARRDKSDDTFYEDNTEEQSPSKIWLSPEEENIQEEDIHSNSYVPDTDNLDDTFELVMKTEPQDAQEKFQDSYKVKKKRIKHRISSSDSSETSNRQSTDSNSMNDDEFEIYGKYIASQLRKMSLQKALRIQLEIQRLVSEARLTNDN